ncbi:hypothetical protein [Phorcysia thermohydrogeniphila]|uniref:Fibronectin type-III domain-containing protein n=1 Tax=Phorcysia thermohydrogeniphila TaxID=936138 RepID=A0A4R1GDC4_9BACT|nr:hypothetical protein [Phorcysia thermohydrogeniphila]TCK04575.1 hypothetical protein CLV27_1008 [Phorcysia thermohydrogeniphila]
MKKLLLFFPLLSLFSFTTCGSKGDPKPPFSKLPSPPRISIIQQSFKNPVVVWQKVTTFADGRKLPIPDRVSYVVSVNFGKRKVKVDKTFFSDPIPISDGERRCYAIIAIYDSYESEPSEPVCIIGKEPIEDKPRIKEVKSGDGFVAFTFEPYHDYSVEIFKNAHPPFVKPFKTLPPGTLNFKDEAVKNGSTYTYRFRFSKDSVKGALSKAITVTPLDTTPPLPPRAPIVLKSLKGCLVIWEPSPSADVSEYRVLVKGKRFSTNGKGIYFYFPECPRGNVFVVAVDKAGNLSKPVKAKEVVDEKSCSNNGK